MSASSITTQTKTYPDTRIFPLKNLGLLILFLLTGFEDQALWTVIRDRSRAISSLEALSIAIYLLLLLGALLSLLLGIWNPESLKRWTKNLDQRLGWRWGMVVGLFVLIAYLYLFSPLQKYLSGPWSQFLIAAGTAQLTLFLLDRNREQVFGWSELALALTLFLYPRMIQEARQIFSDPLDYRVITAVVFFLELAIAFCLYSNRSEKLRRALLRGRETLGKSRFVIIGLLCLTPIFHRYLVPSEAYVIYDDIRFAILLIALWAIAYLGSANSTRLVSMESVGISLGVLILTSLIARASLLVVNYPFSLYWSEGNRFYDYSLMFGQSIYNHPGSITNPYGSDGRYVLWGILFLWQGLPIWVHRLWNLILTTVPVLIFAAFLTRKLEPPAVRYGMFFWISFFLTLIAPLHPPFIIGAILIAAFAFHKSTVVRAISIVVAGYYLAISRFTWTFAAGGIGLLIDLLLYYPSRTGSWLRRLAPALLLGILGTIPGLALNLGFFQSTTEGVLTKLIPSLSIYQSTGQNDSLTGAQPLLWYRLFPNSTLSTGVLFLALQYTLLILIILAWLMISGRWKLDWIQKLIVWAVLLAYFSFGLIVSAKIGGGGDLHNLDMYLLTLLIVIVLGIMLQSKSAEQSPWPAWAVGFILYFVYVLVYPFTPFSPSSPHDPSLGLLYDYQATNVLGEVRSEVEKYASRGDVLFMDQRQLLTFGFMPPIRFVPEYEKKYMMDQAMANNKEYFHSYYEDLAHKRFSLIVSEPLRADVKLETEGPFTEENNAWVQWVSNPTLCFYEPIYLSKRTNIQLLVPKSNPAGCEQYLQ